MEQDSLATLAEVFIGLAGFSGIAFVLKSNPSPYYLFRVVLLVCLSIVAIVIALMPAAMIQAGYGEVVVWRTGSGMLVATYMVALPLLLRYRRRARQEELSGSANALLMVVVGLVLCTQIANAVGLFVNYAFSLLFFGLIGLFVYCGTLFIICLTVDRHGGG